MPKRTGDLSTAKKLPYDRNVSLVKENWQKFSLDQLKRKTGLSDGELYYIGYKVLGLEKRVKGGRHIKSLEQLTTLKVNQDLHLRLPGIVAETSGYTKEDIASIQATDDGTAIIIKIAKKGTFATT